MYIDQQYFRNQLDVVAIEAFIKIFEPYFGETVSGADLDTRFLTRNLVNQKTAAAYMDNGGRYADAIELRYWLDVHINHHNRIDRRMAGAGDSSACVQNWWRHQLTQSTAYRKGAHRYAITELLTEHALKVLATVVAGLSDDRAADYEILLGWETFSIPNEIVVIPKILFPTRRFEKMNLKEKTAWAKTVFHAMTYFQNESLAAETIDIAHKINDQGRNPDVDTCVNYARQTNCSKGYLVERNPIKASHGAPENLLLLTPGTSFHSSTCKFFTKEN